MPTEAGGYSASAHREYAEGDEGGASRPRINFDEIPELDPERFNSVPSWPEAIALLTAGRVRSASPAAATTTTTENGERRPSSDARGKRRGGRRRRKPDDKA